MAIFSLKNAHFYPHSI